MHRSQSTEKDATRQSARLAESNPKPVVPPGAGGSFVDVSLKVIVKQAQGTMLAFQPDLIHGTTVSHGAVNHIIAVTFCRSVAEMRKERETKDGSKTIIESFPYSN